MKSLVYFSCLIAVAFPAFSQTCEPVQEYDQIVERVTEKFYDKTFRGLDWNDRVAFYRKKVSCRANAQNLAAVVNQLLGELKVSHTALYTAEDLEYWALQSIFSRNMDDFPFAFPGIWPERSNGVWYAKYVLPNSAADKAGILQGDQLIRLNKKEFRPTGFSDGIEATLLISSNGKKKRTVTLVPIKESMQQALLNATDSSRRIFSVNDKKIGYFHLWSGTHELFLKSLNAALANFENEQVDALVLDFRGGFGGASIDYLASLKASPYLLGIPKAALVDDGVRSGKELVVATLKYEHLAILVGSKTAAAFLGASPFRFSNNTYLLYLAIGNYIPPNIGPIEGVGVEPDIAVAACRMLCEGKDLQLEEALRLVAAESSH